MKIYLDNCCLNRPYDDQTRTSVFLEAQAKMRVQDMIRSGDVKLVSSFMLRYEMSRNPSAMRKRQIGAFVRENASEHVFSDACDVANFAEAAMATGVKAADAYHVACARSAGCDFFLTTDKRLLKYSCDCMELVNPIEFVMRMEAGDDDE